LHAYIARIGGIYFDRMTKRLVDIDDRVLRAAQRELGTSTIKATVNGALERVAGSETASVRRSLDVLAKAELASREDAWR
jgi:Arc/MetJ family transcription regulator